MRRLLGSWLGLALIATAFVVGGTVRPAYACSCALPTTDQQAFDESDAVFVGTVADVNLPNTGPIVSSTDPAIWTFDVNGVFKGAVAARQQVVSVRGGASCGLELAVGQKYVVFAWLDAALRGGPQPGPGQLSGWLCNGTRPARDGPLDVADARSRAPTKHSSARNLVVEGLAHWDGARTGLRSARELVLSFVGGSATTPKTSNCWEGYRARVWEDPIAVMVTIRRLRNAQPVAGESTACTDVGYARTLRVQLPSALGNRPVLDGATGESHAAFNGTQLLQPKLPRGWSFGFEVGTPCCRDGENELVWSRTFGPPGESSPTVTIVQGPPKLLAQGTRWSDPSTRTVTVRGHKADIVAVPTSTYVRWIEAGSAYVVESDDGLPVARLVEFARSLR